MELPKISAAEFVATNLQCPTLIEKAVEVVMPDGQKETFQVRFKVLSQTEILSIKATAARKMAEKMVNMPKEAAVMTTKETCDDLLAEFMQAESVYHSCYNIEDDGRVFPSAEKVGLMAAGTVASFANAFWQVQAEYSVSRTRLSDEELIMWDEYILQGLDADFFFRSLVKQGAILDFLKFSASQRLKERQLNTTSSTSSTQSTENLKNEQEVQIAIVSPETHLTKKKPSRNRKHKNS